MNALIIVGFVVSLFWGIEHYIGRRVTAGLADARKDLNDAQERHIAALKEALELTERQVLLLKLAAAPQEQTDE